jgi:hypothetical protein
MAFVSGITTKVDRPYRELWPVLLPSLSAQMSAKGLEVDLEFACNIPAFSIAILSGSACGF